MNDNYDYKLGSLFIATATIMLAWQMTQGELEDKKRMPYRPNAYKSSVTPSTFDQYRNVVTGEYCQGGFSFEEEISNIYTNLLLGQQSLGGEFQKVLYENLWNLYES